MPALSLWCVDTLEPDLVLCIIGVEHHDGISSGDMNNATFRCVRKADGLGKSQ
jgi:hypothetical protein